jgi:uncharacterized protein
MRELAGWRWDAHYGAVMKVELFRSRLRSPAAKGGGMVPRWVLGLGLALMLAFGAGCEKDAPQSALAALGSNLPTQAQPKLTTLKLWLGPHELTAEIARNERERSAGMMFRTNIAENEAMLFVFPYAAQVSFWMKNVPIPLSCAYLNREGVILEVHELKPHDETPVPSKSREVQYVLETAHGWFDRNQVGAGVLVQTEKGTLRETFFGRPVPAGR